MNPSTLPAAPAEPLAQLRGLHLPDPVGFWPPAPGWWALAGFVVAAAIVTLLLARRRRRSLGHHALREVGRVAAAGRDVQDTAAALSELMRRVAIKRWGADQVAALHGRDWEHFLASSGPPAPRGSRRRALDAGAARLLAVAPYAPPHTIELRCEDVTIERAKLLHAVRRWIKRNA